MPRSAIVLAKFLVLFTVGMTSAVLMVGSMGALLAIFGSSLEGNMAVMVRSIGLPDLAMVTLMLGADSCHFCLAAAVDLDLRKKLQGSGRHDHAIDAVRHPAHGGSHAARRRG